MVQPADADFFHAGEVNTNTLTRARLIQIWFAGVAFVIAAFIAFDIVQ